MRVDVVHNFANNNNATPWHEVLAQARRRITAADRAGLDGFWLGEHHFDYGDDQSPNPVMLLADLATRTERIRVGTAAVILPLWHPLRLAEDIAILDNMTSGRVDIALSRGILQAEIVNLNPEADRANDPKSKEIFAERLAVLKQAWSGGPLSWHSKRFQLPDSLTSPRGVPERYLDSDGKVSSLTVVPAPYQDGGPALFSVTDTPGGFSTAAEQGLGVITWFPTRGVLDDLNATYRQHLDTAMANKLPAQKSAACLRGCLVAPTDAEARELTEHQVESSVAFIDKVRGRAIWLDKGETVDDADVKQKAPFDLLLERDHLLVGSPETVAQTMIGMGLDHGVDHWLLSHFHDENDELVERSMTLMAQEVMPRVRKALDANG